MNALFASRHLYPVLLPLLLAGCQSTADIFKKTGRVLMNPSIAVGEPNQQPTRLIVSLHADEDVNPMKHADAPLPRPPSPPNGLASEEGAFRVQLQSPTRQVLQENLRSLLNYMDAEDSTSTRSLAALASDDARLLARYGDTRPPMALALQAPALAAPVVSSDVSLRLYQLRDNTLFDHATVEALHADPAKALGSTLVRADDYTLSPGQFKSVTMDIHQETRYVAVAAFFHDTSDRWRDRIRVEPLGRPYPVLLSLRGHRVAMIDEDHVTGLRDTCPATEVSR